MSTLSICHNCKAGVFWKPCQVISQYLCGFLNLLLRLPIKSMSHWVEATDPAISYPHISILHLTSKGTNKEFKGRHSIRKLKCQLLQAQEAKEKAIPICVWLFNKCLCLRQNLGKFCWDTDCWLLDSSPIPKGDLGSQNETLKIGTSNKFSGEFEIAGRRTTL